MTLDGVGGSDSINVNSYPKVKETFVAKNDSIRIPLSGEADFVASEQGIVQEYDNSLNNDNSDDKEPSLLEVMVYHGLRAIINRSNKNVDNKQ